MSSSTPPNSTLHLPRILCLHGGGVSADIFALQCRSIIASLQSTYRLVFADGPFFCEMHPDLRPVYGGMGPTYRWSPWLSSHQQVDGDDAADEIEYAMQTAMTRDQGSGEWIGLLGFSQGAKVAVSVLLENQLRAEKKVDSGEGPLEPEEGFAKGAWSFGVILAGRAPPHSLSNLTQGNPFFALAGQTEIEHISTQDNTTKLRMPTLHVHGLQDEGLELHRELLYDYCEGDASTLIEWDAGHRVPFKPVDVERVVKGILKTAKKAGVGASKGRRPGPRKSRDVLKYFVEEHELTSNRTLLKHDTND